MILAESVPSTEDLKVLVPSGEDFDELVAARQEIVSTIKFLTAKKADLDVILGGALDLSSLKRVIACKKGVVVTRGEARAGSKKIDAAKLLQLGVAPHIIQQATIVGKPGAPGVSVRSIKEGSDDEDGQW